MLNNKREASNSSNSHFEQGRGKTRVCLRTKFSTPCGARGTASVRKLEDSKAPAIFGQRSAILPNGKVSLSSALWYDIFFQLPKFKISPFLGTFIDQRKKNRAK